MLVVELTDSEMDTEDDLAGEARDPMLSPNFARVDWASSDSEASAFADEA